MAAFIHHVPFRQLLPADRPPQFAFAAAYLGSDRIGEALVACEKLSHVFCGHSHWRSRIRINKMDILAIGSTYKEKHLEVLELQ